MSFINNQQVKQLLGEKKKELMVTFLNKQNGYFCSI